LALPPAAAELGVASQQRVERGNGNYPSTADFYGPKLAFFEKPVKRRPTNSERLPGFLDAQTTAFEHHLWGYLRHERIPLAQCVAKDMPLFSLNKCARTVNIRQTVIDGPRPPSDGPAALLCLPDRPFERALPKRAKVWMTVAVV
jgi:hypothetical protein